MSKVKNSETAVLVYTRFIELLYKGKYKGELSWNRRLMGGS